MVRQISIWYKAYRPNKMTNIKHEHAQTQSCILLYLFYMSDVFYVSDGAFNAKFIHFSLILSQSKHLSFCSFCLICLQPYAKLHFWRQTGLKPGWSVMHFILEFATSLSASSLLCACPHLSISVQHKHLWALHKNPMLQFSRLHLLFNTWEQGFPKKQSHQYYMSIQKRRQHQSTYHLLSATEL